MINLAFYTLIFHYTPTIGAGSGWGKYQFFLFLATALFINSLVQAFFMTNADELSELVRTGRLDFALLKPIDTQFLVSLTRIDWSSLGNFVLGLALMGYSMCQAALSAGPVQIVLYPLYVALRRGDLLQPDDRTGGHQRVAGPQSDAVRLLVLHHQLLPLSDGNLPGPVGHAAAAGVHLLHAGAGGGERAGADFGPAGQPAVAGRLVAARFCPVCHGGQPNGVPLGVSAGVAELSKREQLEGGGHAEAEVILRRKSC